MSNVIGYNMPAGETQAGRFIGFSPTGLVAVPAVLNARQTAQLLGFSEADIPVFVANKLLKPLGKPTKTAPKYFATSEIERLAQDVAWLHKAAQIRYEYWQIKNGSRRTKIVPTENSPCEQIAVAE
jgi:hypothetical protein